MQECCGVLHDHGRPVRWLRATVPVALAAVLILSVVGCTTSIGPAGRNGLSAKLNDPAAPVAVVSGGRASEVSVGVSRALFATAPVVVVAQAGDRTGIGDGAEQAGRLGVPLLLIDGDQRVDAADSSSSLSGPTPSASSRADDKPAPLGQELKGEVARLDPEAVLAMDPAVESELSQLPGVRVVANAKDLPAVSPARGDAALSVLVRQGLDESASAAATAAAKAVGAQPVPVNGADLRGDPAAIAALAQRPPRRVLAVGDGFAPVERLTQRLAVAETGTQLPAGGQVLFPGHRLVALYGHPGAPELGALGEQGMDASISRVKKAAADYESLSSVPVVPAFEIIATTAHGAPGKDGNYSGESSVAELRPWVEKASQEGLYVVLDLQPGRANLLDQAKLYTELLHLPHVGLALDPEWKLTPEQKPLEQIGSVDATEINSVITWLAELTTKDNLPQKLLVLHQFRLSMIRHEDNLDLNRDDIQVLIHMDGQGTPALKDATWQAVTGAAPEGMPFGWKNFYDEDRPLLTPAQTMAKQPNPLMISYQ